MSMTDKKPKRSKSIISGLVFSLVLSLIPQSAFARKAECWPGGTSPWIDGYIYCMVAGSDCYYCEVS